MCIIIVAPPHKTPDWDNLVQATWENDDGSGWVIRTPHGLEIFRSARGIDKVLATFKGAREQWPDSWAVWHSRLATHGHIDDANTHPFQVPNTPWALVHNGIMPLNDGPFRDDRSDSRILAEDCIGTQSWADLRTLKEPFEKWLQGDKVVLISGQKEEGGPVIIFNEDLGKWDKADECWYSHPLYWPKRYATGGSYGKYGSGWKYAGDDEDGIDWEAQDALPSTALAQLESGDNCPDCTEVVVESGLPDTLVCIGCGEMWETSDPDADGREMTVQEEQEMYDAMTYAERNEMYADVFAASLVEAEGDNVQDEVIVDA